MPSGNYNLGHSKTNSRSTVLTQCGHWAWSKRTYHCNQKPQIIYFTSLNLSFFVCKVEFLRFVIKIRYENVCKGFPGGAVVKNPPAKILEIGSHGCCGFPPRGVSEFSVKSVAHVTYQANPKPPQCNTVPPTFLAQSHSEAAPGSRGLARSGNGALAQRLCRGAMS